MGSHNILSKSDRALVAYINSLNPGIGPDSIWPAKRSLDKTINGITAWSHSFSTQREDPYSGNVMVEAFVEVRMSGVIEESESQDSPRLTADDVVSAVFDGFFVGDGQSGEPLGQAITAAAAGADADLAAFTVQSCKVVGGNQGFNPRAILRQGDAWVDVIHLEMLCCPSVVGG